MLNICLILIKQPTNCPILCVEYSFIDNKSGNLTLDILKARY